MYVGYVFENPQRKDVRGRGNVVVRSLSVSPVEDVLSKKWLGQFIVLCQNEVLLWGQR